MLAFLFGLVILALDVWAVINIWGSGSGVLAKLLWTLLVLIFPIGGVVIWYFIGPKSA